MGICCPHLGDDFMLLSSSTSNRWSSLVPVVMPIAREEELLMSRFPSLLMSAVTMSGGRRCEGRAMPVVVLFLLFTL